ncbi:hypothetical protein C5F51_20315 [Nocardia nova]|uniref:HTH lysR-type domain-containing protein n=2 Tax=Nocardia nova TaxID=37330 RepID=A0A2S6A3U0_9NOCA|nr:hypothetical protein C5F51_20315 [Nocardia nova]
MTGQVVTILGKLTSYLDLHGAGIDYQRRRDRVAGEIIDQATWRELAFAVDAHPGDDRRKLRLRHANRYLHQMLTGADLADPRHPMAFRGTDDRSQYLRFTTSMTIPLRQALRQHATNVLADLEINEPVTWSPPATLADGLTFPGIDLNQLDIDQIEQLVVHEHRRLVDVADILGVHIEHIRFALERLDRPQRSWPKSAPPSAWRRENETAQILTREFFEREHLHAGHTLTALASTTGFSITVLSRFARRRGIKVRKGKAPSRIDPAWLREQYVDQRRSMPDIAEELGTIPGVVRNALRRLNIPSRAPGSASWREVNLTYHELPTSIRQAVEGTYGGWKRLRRFQIAMQFPMLKSAAPYLGISPSALANQLERLELDLGGPLFTRQAGALPQKPTPLGQALLTDLATAQVTACMLAALDTSDCPSMPDPETLARHRPFRDLAVEPLSIGQARHNLLAAIVIYDPASEFFPLEIIRKTAGKSTTVHRLLAQMTAANWVTRRMETDAERDRRVQSNPNAQRRTYYRFTPDGYRAALRATQTSSSAESEKPMRQPHRKTDEKHAIRAGHDDKV